MVHLLKWDWGAIKGQSLHKGHYSFTFRGHWLGPNATSTLGQVIVDFCLKKKRKKNTKKTKQNNKTNPSRAEKGVQIRQHSRHNFFFLLLTFICGKKKLPIYTTEHCNNVVTLTKILGSWLSLCAWTCICTVILIRYCVVISFLFFISRGVQYGLWGTFSVTGKWGKQML